MKTLAPSSRSTFWSTRQEPLGANEIDTPHDAVIAEKFGMLSGKMQGYKWRKRPVQ